MLEQYFPDPKVAGLVRFHHVRWNHGRCLHVHPDRNPLSSLIYLADRISAAVRADTDILNQVEEIEQMAREGRGCLFRPEDVDAFLSISRREYLWLNMPDRRIIYRIDSSCFRGQVMDLGGMENLAHRISCLIDFTSSFTATHSARVAQNARNISALLGFSPERQREMRIAGYLHDVGKLDIDQGILNKPDTLTPDEYAVVRSHSFYTYCFLEGPRDFARIREWAGLHHERWTARAIPFICRGIRFRWAPGSWPWPTSLPR